MRWLALALVFSLTGCTAALEFLGTKTGLGLLAAGSAGAGAQLLGGSSCDTINLTAELQALSPQNVIIGVDPGGDKEYRLTVNGSIGKTVCECNPASMILSTADGLRLGEPNVLLVGRDECFSNQVTIHVPAGTGGSTGCRLLRL